MSQHILYVKNDYGVPDSIKDRNGDIALSMCKVCHRAEIELDEPCVDHTAVLMEFIRAAQTFTYRVRIGEVKSKRTYTDFTSCLSLVRRI